MTWTTSESELVNETPDGAVSDDVRRASLDPVIRDLAHIATVGFLGVVFIMADKPSGGVATVIVIAAAAVGVALSHGRGGYRPWG